MSADFRRAKIVSTIGPATWEPEVFHQMVEAGTDAVRLNFSHTSHDRAAEILAMVNRAIQDSARPIAIIGDLGGPKIRVADLEDGVLKVEADRLYWFIPEGHDLPDSCDPQRVIPTTYSELSRALELGNRILLDDGRFEFVVEGKEPAGYWISARAVRSGQLKSHKGLNLPGVQLATPSLTAKDHADIAFSRELALDYIALSYGQRPRDLEAARQEMDKDCLLVAKIEKSQALKSLAEIISESDAVMVARGDLGVELPYEEVPIIQKRIIRLAQESARPVITATQMLESMIESPRPTRAEVADVAAALFDGSDAVMLSAETAIGTYPVEAVETMDRIIRRIEHERLTSTGRMGEPIRGSQQIQQTASGAIAAAARRAAERLDSPCIVTFTRSGYTARIVSAQRPNVPILAISDRPRTFNQLALSWGVQPVLFQGEVSYESMLERAREAALELGIGATGQRFVVTAGVPFHVPGTTNMMRIEEF
jgi:pyruvate kinase